MTALKSVSQTKEFKGAITSATNYGLESELIGMPLWLQANEFEDEAAQLMQFIAKCPEDVFVRNVHRFMHRAFNALSTRGLPSSEAWVKQILMDHGGWSEDESDRTKVTPGLLDELAEAGSCKLTVIIGDNPMIRARETATELARLYHRRQVVHAVEALYEKATAPWHPQSAEDIAKAVESVQEAFNRRPTQERSWSSLSTLFRDDIASIERQLAGEEPPRILYGFPSLDRLTGGFQPGNVIVVAARAGFGKTSLGLDVMLAAAKAEHVGVYYSFEMSRQELTRRIASKQLRVNVLRMRHGNLEEFQLDQYRNSFGKGCDLPIIMDDQNLTPSGIEARIREFNRELAPAAVELIVVDHLQLMGAQDKTRYERRDRQIAAYTGQLKDLAKRLGIIVVLLSQLNRQSASEMRPPRLSDLRESGAIEQDADVVLGLYRKFPDTQSDEDRSHAELTILKNRSGPTGKLPLVWTPELATFYDPSKAEEP